MELVILVTLFLKKQKICSFLNLVDYITPLMFEEASKSGNEHAFYGLARIYSLGLGVDRDVKKAWEYLEKAINKGDAESRYLLAIMCLNNDLQNILPDKVLRGISYMEQAALSDNFQPAIDFLQNMESK